MMIFLLVKLSFISWHVASLCGAVISSKLLMDDIPVYVQTALSLKDKGENIFDWKRMPRCQTWWRPVITATCWWVLTSSILWVLCMHLTLAMLRRSRILVKFWVLIIAHCITCWSNSNMLFKLNHLDFLLLLLFCGSVLSTLIWMARGKGNRQKKRRYKKNRTHKWDSKSQMS